MARPGDPAFEKQRAVAESRAGLAPSAGDCGLEVGGRVDHPHAAPATACRGLDQHRVADAQRCGGCVFTGGQRMGLQRGHVQRLHQPLGGELVADAADRRWRRTDPGDALVDHRLGETGVLRQKTIAGVDRVGASAPAGLEQLADVEVGLGRAATVQRDRGVGLAHMRRAGVAIGIHRHRGDAHALRGAEDAARNLAAVGHQQSPDRFDDHIRHVPYSCVPATALL